MRSKVIQRSPCYEGFFVFGLAMLLNGKTAVVNPLFGDIEGVSFRFCFAVKYLRELNCFCHDGRFADGDTNLRHESRSGIKSCPAGDKNSIGFVFASHQAATPFLRLLSTQFFAASIPDSSASSKRRNSSGELLTK